MTEVDLAVNCYERTYLDVLSPGFFVAIERQNRTTFASRRVIINNVLDRADVQARADALKRSGEISDYVFVSDALPEALRRTGVHRWELGRRGYLLDYGLVMATVGESEWLLVWDAELRLERDEDWIGPALELMERRRDVFSAAPRWPRRGYDTLAAETVDRDGDWALNWGASDQILLVRREELASRMWHHSLVPASLARHSRHPFTFEARMESYQRAARRYRASLSTLSYEIYDMPVSVIDRDGAGVWERARVRLLEEARRSLTDRFQHPRWRLP